MSNAFVQNILIYAVGEIGKSLCCVSGVYYGERLVILYYIFHKMTHSLANAWKLSIIFWLLAKYVVISNNLSTAERFSIMFHNWKQKFYEIA